MGLMRVRARMVAAPLVAAAFVVAAALWPGIATAQSFDDLLRTGRAQLDSNKADDAVKAFEKAVKANPKSSDAHLWLARALGTVAQRANVLRQPFLAKRAKSEFEKAVELDSNSVGGREGMLQFYLLAPGAMGGSVGKAREQAAAIAKLNALRGHFAAGNIASNQKDVAGAEKAYRAAATEFPDSLNAVTSLANFLTNNGRGDEAFAPLDRYLSKKPDDRVAMFWVGRTSGVTGRQLDRGEQMLRSVLASHPTAPPPAGQQVVTVAREAIHLRLGDIAAKRGDKAKARASYEEALRVNPNYEQAKRALKAL